MASDEKERGGSGALASVRPRREAVEATGRKDHGDSGLEKSIKRRDIPRAPSQPERRNHERKWFDAIQTRQSGRSKDRIVSRVHLQRRDGRNQSGSEERGLEGVKEWGSVGTAQSLCRRSWSEERSRERSQTRRQEKSQFGHRPCQQGRETRGQRPLRVRWDPSILGGCVTCLSGEDRCGVERPGFPAWTWRPFSRKNADAVNPDVEDPRDVDEDVVKR